MKNLLSFFLLCVALRAGTVTVNFPSPSYAGPVYWFTAMGEVAGPNPANAGDTLVITMPFDSATGTINWSLDSVDFSVTGITLSAGQTWSFLSDGSFLLAYVPPPTFPTDIAEATLFGFETGMVTGMMVFLFGLVLRHFRRLGDANPSL